MASFPSTSPDLRVEYCSLPAQAFAKDVEKTAMDIFLAHIPFPELHLWYFATVQMSLIERPNRT